MGIGRLRRKGRWFLLGLLIAFSALGGVFLSFEHGAPIWVAPVIAAIGVMAFVLNWIAHMRAA